MINDLQLPDADHLHKYMDDGTVTEICETPGASSMQDTANTIVDWSDRNNMGINPKKTLEMVISFKRSNHKMISITINGTNIQQVNVTNR